MTTTLKKFVRFFAVFAVLAAMAVPTAAFAARGAPPPRGGGRGGGGGTETATNNLSVPTVFIGAAGFGLTNPALQPPTGDPSTGYEISGYYYVQGTNKWQAQYVVQANDQATAKWGDNLTGSASLKAGSPIRVEMSLTSDDVTALQGYSVVKLQPTLADRLSKYGTQAFPTATGYEAHSTVMPASVWVAGAQLTIVAPSGTSTTVALPGEINAGGAPVFGYNWTPAVPGTYQLQFQVPTGTVTFSNPTATVLNVSVTSTRGGGGRVTPPPRPTRSSR